MPALTPETAAAYIVPVALTVVLVVRGLRARLSASAGASAGASGPVSVSLEDLKKFFVELEDLRREVADARDKIQVLEDRLDKRDRRVGFLEARIDELTEDNDQKEVLVSRLRAEVGRLTNELESFRP